MSAVAMVAHQFRYDQRIFWRSPAAVFFTVLLPIVFLLLFATIFGNETLEDRGGMKVSTYYVPGILTLAVVSATLVNVAMRLVEAREEGRLKRMRMTPLPAWTYVAGRIGNALIISLVMTVIVTAIGAVLYGVEIPTTTIPAMLVTLLVGAFAFSALGFALSAAIPSEEAAPAITNVSVLPLYFLSGVFIPESEIPGTVLEFADHFPIRPFFECMLAVFDPLTTGAGFVWGDLAMIAAWGLGGLLIALKTFRWSPRGS